MHPASQYPYKVNKMRLKINRNMRAVHGSG